MAESKLIGNSFFLRLVIDEVPVYIVCEQTSELSMSSEQISVLCKTSGAWPEILSGGSKSGSISFTGAYVKDPDSPNISWAALFPLLGTTQEYIWGGIEPGDDQVTGDAHISEISLGAETNAAITFNATLTLSGEPVVSKVSS